MHIAFERGRWRRKDITERNTPKNGQRHSLTLYQCKPDYYLGLEGHFTFYTPTPLILLPLPFLKATFILKAAQEEIRGGKRLKKEEKKDEKHP